MLILSFYTEGILGRFSYKGVVDKTSTPCALTGIKKRPSAGLNPPMPKVPNLAISLLELHSPLTNSSGSSTRTGEPSSS